MSGALRVLAVILPAYRHKKAKRKNSLESEICAPLSITQLFCGGFFYVSENNNLDLLLN